MRHLAILMCIAFSTLVACSKPTPPVVPTTGTVVVTTSLGGSATIFLNGVRTAFATPHGFVLDTSRADTFEVEVAGRNATPAQRAIRPRVGAVDTVVFTINDSMLGVGLAHLTVEPNVCGATLFVQGVPVWNGVGVEGGPVTVALPAIPVGHFSVEMHCRHYRPYTRFLQYGVDIGGAAVEPLVIEMTPRRTVLVEDFTNMSCVPCLTVDANIDDLIGRWREESLMVIQGHLPIVAANDPMYLYDRQELLQRMDYYRIGSLPDVRVDGKLVDGKILTLVENAIIADEDSTSVVGMSMLRTTTTDSVIADLSLLTGLGGPYPESGTLIAVLVEEDVHFPSPPGSNGQTSYPRTIRDMLPNGLLRGEGEPYMPGMTTLHFAFPMPLPTIVGSTLDVNKLRVVIYYQASDGKILQAIAD